MKRTIGFALVTILLVTALAFYVLAQGQPVSQNRPPERLQEEKQNAVKKTMLIDKQVITLLQTIKQRGDFFDAVMGEYGKLAYVQIPAASANKPITFRNATLRIEMQDGSVQEIPLYRVKEVTIEQEGNIQ